VQYCNSKHGADPGFFSNWVATHLEPSRISCWSFMHKSCLIGQISFVCCTDAPGLRCSMFSGFRSICWSFASSDRFAWPCLRMAGKNDTTVSLLTVECQIGLNCLAALDWIYCCLEFSAFPSIWKSGWWWRDMSNCVLKLEKTLTFHLALVQIWNLHLIFIFFTTL